MFFHFNILTELNSLVQKIWLSDALVKFNINQKIRLCHVYGVPRIFIMMKINVETSNAIEKLYVGYVLILSHSRLCKSIMRTL